MPASFKSRNLLHYVLFATVVLWITIGFRYWNDDSGAIKSPADRTIMHDLALPQLDGMPWRLSEHRGDVVLINYWATWCEPCRQELPGLVKLARDYRTKGLTVVGVSMEENRPNLIRQFVTEYRIPYPVLQPPSLAPFESSVQALPTTILVDREGRAAKTYIGAVREPVFQADVDRLLAEKPSVPVAEVRN